MSGESNVGSVDWSKMNQPAIWALIGGENYCDIANRPLDWDNLVTQVQTQRKRLAAAAERLEDVWPQAKSDSAATYQKFVAGMLTSMDNTITSAQSTAAGLNGVVTALSTAQTAIAGIGQTREANSKDLVPRWLNHAEDKADKQAQAEMIKAEKAVADHSAQIQAPALFEMHPPRTDTGQHITGSGGTGGSGTSAGGSGISGLKAVPSPVSRAGTGQGNYLVTPGSGDGTGSSGDPGSGTSGSGTSGSGTSDTGPVLSGITPIPSGGLTGGAGGVGLGVPGAGGVGSGGAGGGFGSLPAGAGVLPLGAGGLGNGISGFGVLPEGAGAAGVRRQVSVKRAMPSGAVIGEDSERGVGARSASSEMPMGGAGGRGRRGADGETIEGEPDQLWAIAEGVAPVIEPEDAPGRHDPGPGVIGFRR